jgi:hypothetical protein
MDRKSEIPLTDSAKLHINEYVGGMLRDWLKWVGVANFAALVVAMAYVFFILPGNAVNRINENLGEKLLETREQLAVVKASLNTIEQDAQEYKSRIQSMRKDLEMLSQENNIKEAASIIRLIKDLGEAENFLERISDIERELKNLPEFSARKIAAGSTIAGDTDWEPINDGGGSGYGLHVDTEAAGFRNVPAYIISVGGGADQWRLTGTSAIYNPTAKGFDVYIRHLAWSKAQTKEWANAENRQWHLNWIGIEVD